MNSHFENSSDEDIDNSDVDNTSDNESFLNNLQNEMGFINKKSQPNNTNTLKRVLANTDNEPGSKRAKDSHSVQEENRSTFTSIMSSIITPKESRNINDYTLSEINDVFLLLKKEDVHNDEREERLKEFFYVGRRALYCNLRKLEHALHYSDHNSTDLNPSNYENFFKQLPEETKNKTFRECTDKKTNMQVNPITPKTSKKINDYTLSEINDVFLLLKKEGVHNDEREERLKEFFSVGKRALYFNLRKLGEIFQYPRLTVRNYADFLSKLAIDLHHQEVSECKISHQTRNLNVITPKPSKKINDYTLSELNDVFLLLKNENVNKIICDSRLKYFFSIKKTSINKKLSKLGEFFKYPELTISNYPVFFKTLPEEHHENVLKPYLSNESIEDKSQELAGQQNIRISQHPNAFFNRPISPSRDKNQLLPTPEAYFAKP